MPHFLTIIRGVILRDQTVGSSRGMSLFDKKRDFLNIAPHTVTH
jgi:hypothetical protein